MTITRFMVVLAAGCLMAQAPIGMGPGRLVQTLQLGPSGTNYGDTEYCSAWLSSAASLPVTTGLPVVCTSNDAVNNIRLFQLDTLNWSGSTVHATLLNGMSSYGGASETNVPAGWWGYCSQRSLGSPPTSDGGQGCSWKSREALARNGCLYLPVERQITAGTASDHDATIVKSCDSGATWTNVYNSTPDATGNAPLPCSTTPCNASSPYTNSMMWFFPANGYNGAPIYNWSFIQYGQDGALPAGINGGLTDPSQYACAFLGDGSLGCAPNASILDVTTWRYYAGRITAGNIPDRDNLANWTYLFDVRSTTSLTAALGSQTFTITAGLPGLSNGTRVYVRSMGSSSYMEGLVTSYSGTSLTLNVDAIAGSGAHADWDITPRTHVFETGVAAGVVDYTRLSGILSAPVYIKEFKSYLLSGGITLVGGAATVGFMAAPQPTGPWTTVYVHPTTLPYNQSALGLGAGYTVVSTSPPVIRVTNVANAGTGVGTAYAWYFTQWEFVLGKQPYGNGDVSAYTNIGIKKLNSGWVFGSGDVPGTFNRNGLVWAFDFMDHGGVAAATYPYFHDVANNSAILYPCYTDGAITCGSMNSSKGLGVNVDSISAHPGYQARYESRLGELSTGASTPNRNAPSAMTGNGTFSVVGVFRLDATSAGPYWVTGNTSNGNTSVGMYVEGGGGYQLGLLWGGWGSNRWRYLSSFVPAISSWYFMAATVQANGSTPIAHLWTGVGGTLVDEIAGVTYAKTGGSTPQTPNVTAGPLLLGTDAAGYTLSGSYAGLLVYNRVLSATECQGLYRTLKTKMSERGIAVQ
jgi:hypothetical protein